MPKPSIDRKLLLKVADNARLKLTEKEIKKFLPELEEILKTFSKIDEVNVESEIPSYHAVEVKNIFREDKVHPCLSPEQALSNTRHKKGNYFLGPKVV